MGSALALAVLLGVATPSAVAAAPLGGAFTAPGDTPVVAAAESGLRQPAVLFLEDFENSPTIPTLLANYVPATAGVQYTADTYWSDPKYCNGFITSFNTALNDTDIFNTYCGRNSGSPQGDYQAVRAKAYALGQLVNAANPGANRALSTNTSGGTPTRVMFQTATNDITLTTGAGDSPTRLVALSVDVADTTGGNEIASPQLYFYLLQDGTPAQKLNDLPLPGGEGTSFDLVSVTGESFPSWARAGVVGTYFSKPFEVDSTAKVGLRLENTSAASSQGCGAYRTLQSGLATGSCISGHSGTTNGNDGAIDNVRIVDVTPVMDKAFAPALQSIGKTSQMTLTVNNRADLEAKTGWQFTDTLPAGLKFANSTTGGTCLANGTNAVVDINAGTLVVTNGVLAKGQASCTITTTVTASEPGSYVNGNPNGNFSNKQYIDGPANATVEFYAGALTWNKVDAEDEETLLAGSAWTLAGPVPATASTPASGWPVGSVTDCVAATEAACTGLDRDPVAGKFRVSGLPDGTYTLVENVAPVGYEAIAGPLSATITAGVDASFGTAGNVGNAKIPVVTWSKVDPDGNRLSNSEWKIVGPGPSTAEIVIVDCVGENEPSAQACQIDRDATAGGFRVEDLDWGDYKLIETRAPAGYERLDDPIPFKIGVGEGLTLHVDLGDIENQPRQAPALPLTGGIGSDLFTLLGGGVLVLGIGAVLALQLRKRRQLAQG